MSLGLMLDIWLTNHLKRKDGYMGGQTLEVNGTLRT